MKKFYRFQKGDFNPFLLKGLNKYGKRLSNGNLDEIRTPKQLYGIGVRLVVLGSYNLVANMLMFGGLLKGLEKLVQ